uniref:Uncharacterized protein n=1 Tax=Setaria viridis TaxID=4556 RepID=A0A4U6UC64_SETVI|nr:hypothetical protein SEVIR_5G098500v2 [Setaria viridis]
MAAACGTRIAEAAAHGSAAAFGGGGRLGLFVASVAITWAVIEPPPWLDKNAYFLALSGAFFAGMAHVTASVLPTDPVAAAVAGLRQAALEVAHGARLGLLAASTAITLAALGEKQPPPGVSSNTAYFLTVSGAFFAGVAQVAASVSAGDGGRPRDAARKLVYASLVLLFSLALASLLR